MNPWLRFIYSRTAVASSVRLRFTILGRRTFPLSKFDNLHSRRLPFEKQEVNSSVIVKVCVTFQNAKGSKLILPLAIRNSGWKGSFCRHTSLRNIMHIEHRSITLQLHRWLWKLIGRQKKCVLITGFLKLFPFNFQVFSLHGTTFIRTRCLGAPEPLKSRAIQAALQTGASYSLLLVWFHLSHQLE